MQQNSGFSMADAAKLLSTPAGRQLLALLQQDGGARMQQAMEAYRAGNPGRAKEILSPLLDTPEVRQLLAQLKEG